MSNYEVLMTCAFLLVHLFTPAWILSTSPWAQRQKEPLSPVFWLSAALVFHLLSSILFRLLCHWVPMHYWVYAGAHLIAGGYWIYRHWDQGRFVKQALKRTGKKVFSSAALAFLIGLIFIRGMFYGYQFQAVQYYFQDEHQRASIAQAIAISYPPPEFQVYAPNSTYHYYNFTEVFAVNLAQFSGVAIENIYFYELLVLNWILVFIGIWAIAGAHSRRSGWVVLPLFVFYFLIQGVGGAEKILHFTLRQNTFALGLSFLAISLLLKFSKGERIANFQMALLLVGLITGVKLLAVTPLVFILPLIGLWALYKRHISFVSLGLHALALISMVLGIYWLIIYNPAASAQGSLVFDPHHYWLGFWSRQFSDPYHNELYVALVNYLETTQGGPKLHWVLPPFFTLEYTGLAIVGLFLLGWRHLAKYPAPLFVLAGGWASMAIITLFKFHNLSSSSIEYFLLFGAWVFSAQAVGLFAEGMAKQRSWGAFAFLVFFFGYAMNSYAYKDIDKFRGLTNHFLHSGNEMVACDMLREQSAPTDWVLHNFYRYPSNWSFNSLCARRAVISSTAGGAINQNGALYAAITPLANRYFEDQMDSAEAAQFLANHEVKWVIWVHRLKSVKPSALELLENVYYAEETVALYRVKLELLPPKGPAGTSLPAGSPSPLEP
ncbi:MAG: hypothetical protein RRB13_00635 [bacterium]|nr:hypothetical protein [bacterium]